jgi:hypothetical protein
VRTFLVVAVTVAATLTIAVGVVVSLRGREPGRIATGLALLTGAVVVVQSVVAGIGLVGGPRPAEFATALGYLIGIVFVMPIGIGWSLADRGKYSGYVLAVAAFTVVVMTVRLVSMWKVTA